MNEANTSVENIHLDVTLGLEISPSDKISEAKITFNDIPVEIATMIWKSTLPGPRLIQFSLPLRVLRSGTCTVDCPLPVALHICKLSRETVLEEYRIVYEHYVPYFQAYKSADPRPNRPLFPITRHRPVCFNPKVDQFCIDAAELFELQNRTELQKVVTEFPKCLDDIHVLEIRNVIWASNTPTAFNPAGLVEMGRYRTFNYGALNLFKNLKELYVISARGQKPCGNRPGIEATRRAHADLMNWYLSARDLDPHIEKRSIPHISFHCRREKGVLSEEDRRCSGKITATESNDSHLMH